MEPKASLKRRGGQPVGPPGARPNPSLQPTRLRSPLNSISLGRLPLSSASGGSATVSHPRERFPVTEPVQHLLVRRAVYNRHLFSKRFLSHHRLLSGRPW